MAMQDKDKQEIRELNQEKESPQHQAVVPPILEEITIEELAVDGICGIY